MVCMPRIADCGGFRIGVDISEPYTPPLEMVNVPPVISSTPSLLAFARVAKSLIAPSMPAKLCPSQLRSTGTTSPFSVPTATAMSQ